MRPVAVELGLESFRFRKANEGVRVEEHVLRVLTESFDISGGQL